MRTKKYTQLDKATYDLSRVGTDSSFVIPNKNDAAISTRDSIPFDQAVVTAGDMIAELMIKKEVA